MTAAISVAVALALVLAGCGGRIEAEAVEAGPAPDPVCCGSEIGTFCCGEEPALHGSSVAVDGAMVLSCAAGELTCTAGGSCSAVGPNGVPVRGTCSMTLPREGGR